MKTIIIDDERSGRMVLQAMLRRYCTNVEIVATASSAEDGVKAIREHRPDLVFLDVEMPQQNGFALLESLDERDFGLIFVSAHREYAMRAIKYSPLDYLLKPVNGSELQAAVWKAKRRNNN